MNAGAAARQLLVGGAIVASLVLVGAYLAAGGSSYTPEKMQDPCEQRPWRDPEGLQEIAEQFSLSALDGAACELGVTPRDPGPGAGDAERRASASASATGSSDEELARAIRAGLLRAVDDAEEAGALSPLIAGPLRGTVAQIPLDQAIELINDAESLLGNVAASSGRPKTSCRNVLP